MTNEVSELFAQHILELQARLAVLERQLDRLVPQPAAVAPDTQRVVAVRVWLPGNVCRLIAMPEMPDTLRGDWLRERWPDAVGFEG